MHESNSFSSKQTGLDDFAIQRGDDVIDWWGQAHHEVGGFIEGTAAHECVPIMMAGAIPSGTVTVDAFEKLTAEFIERLQSVQPVDGLLLALHGAMVSERYRDADAEIARRIRVMVGPDFPIVITHDFHANISQQLVEQATALVVYKTNPHLDQGQRGIQAANILIETIAGHVHPVQALLKPEVFLNIVHQYTSREPMRMIMEAAEALERQPHILAANVAAGYQYADVAEMGPTVVVVADGDADLAQRSARQLADRVYEQFNERVFDLPNATDAVHQAMQSTDTPVVLVEMGDNIGGGSAGDSTFILNELVKQNVRGWMVVLYDPEAVSGCMSAGINADFDRVVGGKTDDRHGDPVQITGRVKSLHNGQYIETEPRHGGQRYRDQGLTAVVEVGSAHDPSYLVLTSNREPPFSLQQLLSLGIQPQRQHILVVKAAIAYRAAYEPIAGSIIEVDTPGLTAVNPAHFTYEYGQLGVSYDG